MVIHCSFSFSASRLEVASSKIRILGFLTAARAMASLCFWPPDSWVPMVPASVSRPPRNEEMKSNAFASLAALMMSSEKCFVQG